MLHKGRRQRERNLIRPVRRRAIRLSPERDLMIEMRLALVFDYDGVIADTEPLHWRSWVALLSCYDIPFEWEEYCRIGQGVSDARLYEYFYTRMPQMDAGDFVIQNAERKRTVREWSLKNSPILRETIALLESLDGYRVGLVEASAFIYSPPVAT